MSEDKGFEIVDKRGAKKERASRKKRAKKEAPAEPAVEEQPAAAQPEAPQPEAEEKHEPRPVDVYTTVTWMVGMLASSAWLAMGLQINPGTGKIEKDLAQARTAIDCVMALADRVTPHLDEAQRREMRGLISDLQINFVNQSKE